MSIEGQFCFYMIMEAGDEYLSEQQLFVSRSIANKSQALCWFCIYFCKVWRPINTKNNNYKYDNNIHTNAQLHLLLACLLQFPILNVRALSIQMDFVYRCFIIQCKKSLWK